MLFIFAYVDLFSLYRPARAGRPRSGQGLRLRRERRRSCCFTTLYIVVPSFMIYLTLVLPRGINRVLNIVLAVVYAVTVAGSAIGEWG